MVNPIRSRGTVDVLRVGIKGNGIAAIRAAYFGVDLIAGAAVGSGLAPLGRTSA